MDESQIGGIIISLATGLIFCGTGFVMKKYPPKLINGLIGYRTARSMKNQMLWDEGNQYSSALMIKYGALFAIIGALLCFLLEGIALIIIILGLMLVPVAVMFMKVEKRLKELDKES